jgi:DNA-binding response OmpR family regulator
VNCSHEKNRPWEGSSSLAKIAQEANLVTKSEREIGVIFVVDDEELITKSLGLILRREGFDVFGFTNPLEALERMDTVVPDLLISDVMMPQLSGIDLAIQTRRVRPDCRILLFSAAAQELRKQGRARDFRLLEKPLHPVDLLREIAMLQPNGEAAPRPRSLMRASAAPVLWAGV